MAKYLSDEEFFKKYGEADAPVEQPSYLSDEEFFARYGKEDGADAGAKKDDSFFSLDRAKRVAGDVLSLLPGMEGKGQELIDAGSDYLTKSAQRARDNLPSIDDGLKINPPKEKPKYEGVLKDVKFAPDKSRAPVRPEVRKAIESTWDASGGAGRDRLEGTAGWIGQIAGQRADDYKRADDGVMVASPESKRLDKRAESRRDRLASAGDSPEFARRAAIEGAAKGVNPGDEVRALGGTVEESSFDFETRALFDQNGENNGLNNAMVRGVVKGGLGATKALAGYGQFLSEVYGLENSAKETAEYGNKLRSKEQAIGDGREGLARNFEGAVSSIVQQLPLWLTGSQPVALAGMMVQSFGQEYSDGRGKGQTPVQAAERASMFAAFEVIGEKFGLKGNMDSLKKLLDGQTNAAAMGFLSNMLKREIPGELLTTTGQFGVDKFGADGVALNPNATAGDYFAQVKDTIFQTAMQGGLMSGGSKAVGSAANAVADWRQSRIDKSPEDALAQALSSGQFDAAGVDAEVAHNLRTQPATSNMISPEATVMGQAPTAARVDGVGIGEASKTLYNENCYYKGF